MQDVYTVQKKKFLIHMYIIFNVKFLYVMIIIIINKHNFKLLLLNKKYMLFWLGKGLGPLETVILQCYINGI